ncbi:MAG: glycosyltransferase family 4 protein [Rhodobacteraceae bacterium]|nr:glycosyltransferase family 4 protein [Paracoccaceae bacterium]
MRDTACQPGETATVPLRVLEMGTQFGMGGITRHIRALTDWLRIRGHSVTLAGTEDVWGSRKIDRTFLPLPTRYVASDGGSVPVRLVNAARAAWTLRRWLASHPVDVIHCHESAPALVALIARIGTGIPVAVTFHGSEPERVGEFGRIARHCDLVITPSHRAAADLVSVGKVPEAKVKVIGLGVAPAPDDQAEEIDALRTELLDGGDRLIVTVARLLHQKGIDVLIDCVAALKESHPGYRFVVVGDGPDRDKYEALAKQKGLTDRLKFMGRSERPHLYLRAADLFLLTSRWEALPFTIVEAFQCATPAVATACSGVVELIDGTVGATVPIGDVPAICAAVSGILDDEPRRRSMAAAALARSREDRFRPDWVHARFEETYRALAAPRA